MFESQPGGARRPRRICGGSDSRSAHDTFVSHVRGLNVTRHRIVGTTVSTRNLSSLRATVRVELSAANGLGETVALPMSKEDGAWKVCDS